MREHRTAITDSSGVRELNLENLTENGENDPHLCVYHSEDGGTLTQEKLLALTIIRYQVAN